MTEYPYFYLKPFEKRGKLIEKIIIVGIGKFAEIADFYFRTDAIETLSVLLLAIKKQLIESLNLKIDQFIV